jgi:hypothetical protein
LRIGIEESHIDDVRQIVSDLLYILEKDGFLSPAEASGARLFAIESGVSTEIVLSPTE